MERSNHGAIKPDTVSNIARAQLKSANSASFSAVISIAFGKKVSLTPELICSLKELHGHCFSIRVLLSISTFNFELQKVYLNRDGILSLDMTCTVIG